LKHIDWVPYIERRNSLLYVSIFQEAYGPILKKLVGWGFTKQMCLFDGESYQFFQSKKELDEGIKFFSNLNKKKVDYTLAKAELYDKFETKLLEEKNFLDVDWFFDRQKEIFSLLTVIPWMFLDSGKYVNKFMKFRKKSRTDFQNKLLPELCKKISYKSGYTSEDITFFRVNELKEKVRKSELIKRKRACLIYFIDGKRSVSTNPDLIKWAKTLRKIDDKLKGQVACKGKARGKVCIINTANELSKYNGEEILVSVNTTPAMTQVMKKCKAIVTDEGGLTCHAAILSRELNIPCVIGTKNATKLLKDGDIVEVDAEKGEIKRT